MERFDVAIIGTGPAGLSAALTLKLRGKNILLFGEKKLSKKINAAQEIKNYLGLPDSSGETLREKFLAHLSDMEIEITEERIKSVFAMGKYFSLQGAVQNYEAKSIILATGVLAQKPLDGEAEFLGRGVSYCATCDGAFYKGKNIAVAAYSQSEESEAIYLAEICDKMIYFPIYKNCELDKTKFPNIEIIREIPKKIEGEMKVSKILTEKNSYEVDGIFILRENISAGQLVPGLAMDGAHIKVDRAMRTNISGCFACGDATGKPYQYIKSAGEGNVAALSAVDYLAGNEKVSKIEISKKPF